MSELIGPAWLDSRQKRFEDWVLTIGILPVAVPPALMGIGAVCLIDGANPIFRQMRTGQYDNLFEIIKLRSMPKYSDSVSSKGRHDDYRASKVGHILRKLRIDEAPQILNVWQGSMSVIGPRALVEDDYRIAREALDKSSYSEWRKARRLARPGIFDEFGVMYHGGKLPDDEAAVIEARVELDMEYTESASHQKDLAILLDSFKLFGQMAIAALGQSYAT